MLRDVSNLNHRSGLSTRCGFHPRAPEPAVGRVPDGAHSDHNLRRAQPGLQPKLRLALSMVYMDMHPGFLARGEVAAEASLSQHRRAHGETLPDLLIECDGNGGESTLLPRHVRNACTSRPRPFLFSTDPASM